MTAEEYLEEMNGKSQTEIGILLGMTIKDKECTPDNYNIVCKRLKESGFKFVNIEFQ